MFSKPQYTNELVESTEKNPILSGAGNYCPCAITSPEKSKDLPDLVGAYQCGDCVGIIGWDKKTKATFVYHMNNFDMRRMSYGFGKFTLAMLESADITTGTDVLMLKAHMKALEGKFFDNDGEVYNVLEAVRKFDLLQDVNFTLVSNYTDNIEYVTEFLTESVGLTHAQVAVDAPQKPGSSEGAQLLINRQNGNICSDFVYDSKTNKITYNAVDAVDAKLEKKMNLK